MPYLPKNKFKFFRSLKLKKIRQREGKFLLEGIKICHEALTTNVDIHAFLLCPQVVSHDIVSNFKTLCKKHDVPCFYISYDMLLSLSDTVHSQGVICIVEKTNNKLRFQNMSFLLALDAAQEPGNVGTIIRTADWFGLDAVLLGAGSVELYNPKVLRSTMGSIFHLPILSNINFTALLPELKLQGFTIYAADVHSNNLLNKIKFANRKVLVIGNESKGINKKIVSLSDMTIKIPPKGKTESLNISVATGIILSQMVTNNDKQSNS